MKSKDDLARSWIRKAESDLANLELCIQSNRSLDTACFHAQQGAEKYLKAYLTYSEIDFPFMHNLEKLISLCAQNDSSFLEIEASGRQLTPYAVESRYDMDFWPSRQDVEAAYDAALAIKDFVIKRIHSALGSDSL